MLIQPYEIFLQKLIDEEIAAHVDILQICAGQPLKKKKVNEHLEIRLMNLLTNPHQDVLLQISSVAHNIPF